MIFIYGIRSYNPQLCLVEFKALQIELVAEDRFSFLMPRFQFKNCWKRPLSFATVS